MIVLHRLQDRTMIKGPVTQFLCFFLQVRIIFENRSRYTAVHTDLRDVQQIKHTIVTRLIQKNVI